MSTYSRSPNNKSPSKSPIKNNFCEKQLNYVEEMKKRNKTTVIFNAIRYKNKELLNKEPVTIKNLTPAVNIKKVGKNVAYRYPSLEFLHVKKNAKYVESGEVAFSSYENIDLKYASAAAGVLLVCGTKILVILDLAKREIRIPGGKREFIEETSVDIAQREFIEEVSLGKENEKDNFTKIVKEFDKQNNVRCFWINESKYHLFMIQIDDIFMFPELQTQEGYIVWLDLKAEDIDSNFFHPVLSYAIQNRFYLQQ